MGGQDEPIKARLRRELLSRRRAMDPEQVAAVSRAACGCVAAWPGFALAEHLVLYASRQGEADPSALAVTARARRIDIYYPRVVQGQLEFRRAAAEELSTGAFGLLEPGPAAPLLDPNAEGVLVIVPGLAFDGAGRRLGTGRGFYDRALGRMSRAVRLGMVATALMVERLPEDPWDVPMHGIVTETGIIDMRGVASNSGAHPSGD